MAKKANKLSMELKTTNYIEWFTRLNNIGLGEFLAQVSSCQSKCVTLLETPNGVSYCISVTQSEVEDGSFYMEEEHEEINRKINDGAVECWKMEPIFCWLLRNKHIKPGNYEVMVNW